MYSKVTAHPRWIGKIADQTIVNKAPTHCEQGPSSDTSRAPTFVVGSSQTIAPFLWKYKGVITITLSYALLKLLRWNGKSIVPRFRARWNAFVANLGQAHNYDHVRVIFRETRPPPIRTPSNHSHGLAAGVRSAARAAMETVAVSAGLVPFSVQTSTKDDYRGVVGQRAPFWAKDVGQLSRDDPIPNGACIMIHDVDYYLDLPQVMTQFVSPYLMYTTQPRHAADNNEESSHTFDKDGNIQVGLSGGSSYMHQLWDFTPDVIMTTTTTWGFITGAAVYKLEKYNISDLKAVVLATPVHVWRGPVAAYLASTTFEGAPLQRLSPVEQGKEFAWIHLVIDGEKGRVHSIAKCGERACTTLSENDYALAIQHLESGVSHMSVTGTASWMTESDNPTQCALRVKNYFQDVTRHEACRIAFARPPSVASYSANFSAGSEQGPTLHEIFPPIVAGGAYAPTNHGDNGAWAAVERVEKLQTKARDIPAMTPRVQQIVCEFASACATITGKVLPVTPEEVWENRSTARQRAGLEMAAADGPNLMTRFKAFVKRECYDEIKDPRVISTIPGQQNIAWSVYSQALTCAAKKFPFYAFKTPKDVSERMVEICTSFRTKGMDTSDVSRMDGNTGANARYLDMQVLCALVGADEFPKAAGAYRATFSGKTMIGNGEDAYLFWQGLATRSGEGATSFFNTIRTAFMFYMTCRNLGFSHDESWYTCLKGLQAGGDDNAGAIPCGAFTLSEWNAKRNAAASLLGYTLKINVSQPGEQFEFLARHWNPWAGDCTSCANVKRQMLKLHTTPVNPGRKKVEKAIEKAMSILVTDRNTPILGEWAQAVITKYGERRANHEEHSWWARFESENQFKNVREDWMEELVQKQMPGFELDLFRAALQEDPLNMPVCWAVPVTRQVPAYDVLLIEEDRVIPGKNGRLENTISQSKRDKSNKKFPTKHAISKLPAPITPELAVANIVATVTPIDVSAGDSPATDTRAGTPRGDNPVSNARPRERTKRVGNKPPAGHNRKVVGTHGSSNKPGRDNVQLEKLADGKRTSQPRPVPSDNAVGNGPKRANGRGRRPEVRVPVNKP